MSKLIIYCDYELNGKIVHSVPFKDVPKGATIINRVMVRGDHQSRIESATTKPFIKK